MGADVQNEPGSIKTEITRVVRDFSQYLSCLQQMGKISLDISKKSEDQINNWGNNWGTKTRIQQPFFFEGPENANVFIIDSEDNFFKGEGGKLLIKILGAMNLTSGSVFICNTGDLISVQKKIKIISPKVIITLGKKAGQFLLNIQQPLEQFRGKFHEYHGIKVMPTFHPFLLLKQPEYKRQVWEDMKQVMALVMELAGSKDGS
ncbi:MAG: uracil-DNA glycosylase [Desulfobacula sp.]|nr:uracil-DNA glycosylase [Desulfobacula sp.]